METVGAPPGTAAVETRFGGWRGAVGEVADVADVDGGRPPASPAAPAAIAAVARVVGGDAYLFVGRRVDDDLEVGSVGGLLEASGASPASIASMIRSRISGFTAGVASSIAKLPYFEKSADLS